MRYEIRWNFKKVAKNELHELLHEGCVETFIQYINTYIKRFA